MKEFEIKNEIKEKIASELISFVDVHRIKDIEVYEFFKGRDHEEAFEEFWYGKRDEWIEELQDRIFNILEVIGYHKGLEIALALGYWSGYKDNILGIEIDNSETLGFVASYEWVFEKGIIYDVVDECLKNHFDVELN